MVINKAIQEENKLLRGVCTELLCTAPTSGVAEKALTTQEIIEKIKELQEDNHKLLTNNYIVNNMYIKVLTMNSIRAIINT